ncbi:MAG: pantetheine-phosphate adenylyltransferase [Alphaproteobacteria bacterium]|nr:pantetheine-phosphate adenylyltransferase [Alphaproteobacteria bacterium]
MVTTRTGVYPGTFDPITNGHLDLIGRATRLVDHLVIGVAGNPGKQPMFSLDERIKMIEEEVERLDNLNGATFEVRAFDNLLMHFAEEVDANIIVRGLRAVSDFDFEFQMVGMNARLNDRIEIVFLMASENHQFIASSLVKEIARLGGDVTSFVSPDVAKQLVARASSEGRNAS